MSVLDLHVLDNGSREVVKAHLTCTGFNEPRRRPEVLVSGLSLECLFRTMPPINRLATSSLFAPASRLVARTTLAHQGPRAVRWETVGHNPPKEAGGQAGRPQPSTQEPPGAKKGEAGMIRQEGPAEGAPRHQPDYGAAVDYRTS